VGKKDVEKAVDKNETFAAALERNIEEHEQEWRVGGESRGWGKKDPFDRGNLHADISSEMTGLKSAMSSVMIGVICTHEYVPWVFLESLVGMLGYMPKVRHLLRAHGYQGIDELRNQLCRAALHSGATHLFMMDVDMIYPETTVRDLLATHADVVQGLVCRSRPPYDALVLKAAEGKRYHMESHVPEGYTEGDLVDVDAVGGGGTLISREVLLKLEDPWFRYNEVEEDGVKVSEDILFSVTAKEAGFRVVVHTGLKYGHMLPMVGFSQADGDAWGVGIAQI